MTTDVPDGRRLIVIVAAFANVITLARQRTEIPEPERMAILSAILDMIDERENFLSNRAALIDVLNRFADVIPEGLFSRVEQTIQPLALGKIKLPEHSMSESEATPG